jgi:hypothetical protein
MAGAALRGVGPGVGRWDEGLDADEDSQGDTAEHRHGQAYPPDAPALQRDRRPGGREGAELAE